MKDLQKLLLYLLALGVLAGCGLLAGCGVLKGYTPMERVLYRFMRLGD